MKITLQLSQPLARALREKSPQQPDAQKLLRLARELAVDLVPLNPDSDDPRLATYFTADVPDAARAQEVVEQLRRSNAVVAAYVKPPDEPA
jgi:hypothetical protein